MLKDVKGTNALTVLVFPTEEKQKTKVFFCSYRRNIVLKYNGNVTAIQPGFDPNESPQFFVRPQRQNHSDNINYIFKPVEKIDKSTLFWIQWQYFDDDEERKYYC